jgi:purine-binding chemotaxis protein CheW
MKGSVRAMDQAAEGMLEKEGKYLTFTLAGEEYGIGVRKIREIIGMMPVRSVPQAPAFIKGVINLRGKVIPVIDLRLRFDMEETIQTDRTCIVVVEIEGAGGVVITTGVVVDSVSEVLNIKAESIEDLAVVGAIVDTRHILGMAKVGGGVKILLDIDHVLGAQEVSILEPAA